MLLKVKQYISNNLNNILSYLLKKVESTNMLLFWDQWEVELLSLQLAQSVHWIFWVNEHWLQNAQADTIDPLKTQEQFLSSPVGLGEQDGGVWFADKVFISHFADGNLLFLPAGHGLQGQGGLYFWPQHAEVRRKHVDEDLGVEERWRATELLLQFTVKSVSLSCFFWAHANGESSWEFKTGNNKCENTHSCIFPCLKTTSGKRRLFNCTFHIQLIACWLTQTSQIHRLPWY